MKTILVFGGNGFMGAETVAQLLDQGDSSLVLVNRDKSWDFGSRNRIVPNIERLIKWNRRNPLDHCDEFMDWLKDIKKVDIVVDFSGYKPKYMTAVLPCLAEKVGFYIYISTDSIYEVCEKLHNGPTKETDDRRPKDQAQRAKLKRNDKYGYEKWKCEECLQQSDIAYVSLRLADVVGPKDSTERWWQIQLWIQAASLADVPMYIPDELRRRQISLVYSKDVAKLVCDIASENLAHVHLQNNKFNLAFNETVTVEELVQQIASHSRIPCCTIQYSSKSDVPQFYPSVDLGPMDINKSQGLLEWRPSPLSSAIQDCCTFYDELSKDKACQEKRLDIFKSLCTDLKDVYSAQEYEQLQDSLKNILLLK